MTADPRTSANREATFALDDLPAAALVVEPERGRTLAANRAAVELLESTRGALVGGDLADLLVADDADRLARWLFDGAAGGRPVQTFRLAGDRTRWVELTAALGSSGLLVLASEVTESLRHRHVLRHAVRAVAVVDDRGVGLWGPVGRIHPPSPAAPPRRISLAEQLHPEDAASVLSVFNRLRDEPGSTGRVTVRARHPSIEGRWGVITVDLSNLSHLPEIGGILLTMIDHDVEQDVGSLGRTGGPFLSVAEAAPVGIVLTGLRGFPIYFNEASRRLIPGIDWDGAERDWIAQVRASERATFRRWFDGLVEARREGSRTACFAGDPARWLLVTVAPRFGDDGEAIGFVVTLQDVTAEARARKELEAAQQRLLHLATHDPLTGLANRTLALEALDRHAAEANDRGAPTRAGVVFCDLDAFKEINDRFGHDSGDQVLMAVGERLATLCRAPDVVARIGGDEFLVIAHDVTPQQLESIAGRIDEQIREPVVVGGVPVTVGVSVGIAMLEAGEPVDDLLRRADTAMYEHKAARRSPRS